MDDVAVVGCIGANAFMPFDGYGFMGEGAVNIERVPLCNKG